MSSEACVSVSILLKLSLKPHQNKTFIKIRKENVYYEQPKITLILNHCVNYSTSLKMTEVVLSFSRKQ